MECEISLQYEYIIEIDLKSTHLETDCGRLEKADVAQVLLVHLPVSRPLSH